jgi:CheY-like chemotaxis protein
MLTILLVDLRTHVADALVPVLERLPSVVRVATRVHEAIDELQKAQQQFDVVVFDLSANQRSDWEALDAIRTTTSPGSPRQMILCISDVNWGPAMKLEVERKGGRLVFIRE